VTPALLDEAAIAYHDAPVGLDQRSIAAALDPERFIAERTLRGGPAPAESRRQARLFEDALAPHERVVGDIDDRLASQRAVSRPLSTRSSQARLDSRDDVRGAVCRGCVRGGCSSAPCRPAARHRRCCRRWRRRRASWRPGFTGHPTATSTGRSHACNFTGNLELAIGAARTYPFDDAVSSIIQLQAKTVFFPRTDGEWSFGAVASGARDTGAAHGRTAFQSFNVTGLASWYPRDELEIDLNLGVSYLYGSGSFAVAGAAVQYAPIDALQLLGEVFRDEPGGAKFQVGLRGIVVADRFEVYVSYGNRFDAAQWFATAGIRLQTPELFR
jgi:hypothetical protein